MSEFSTLVNEANADPYGELLVLVFYGNYVNIQIEMTKITHFEIETNDRYR